MSDDIPTFGIESEKQYEAPAAHGESALAAFRQEATKRVAIPALRLDVPGRPGFGVEFDVNGLTVMQMQKWARKSSVGPKGGDDVDPLRFSLLLIRATQKAFLHQTEDDEWLPVVDDETGETLTFQSDAIQQTMGVIGPEEAIRAWYGTEGHIIQTATEVTAHAGFGDGDVNPLAAQ